MILFFADTSHSVRDIHGSRWPAPDGIPFLRNNRRDLAQEALGRLDAGETEAGLVLLLADQDDWWRGPTTDPTALRELVRRRDEISLRQAMSLLAWGPVADYFAHRWSDPTFLAGLALTEAHWNAPRTAFELACGIGHHLRELSRRGVTVTGADIVFAKLWVARHFVAPNCHFICFDAAGEWPIEGHFDLIVCHDAFYFLEPKSEIVRRLGNMGNLLIISHIHNRAYKNFSAGSAVTAEEMAVLFPDALLYDDSELTEALIQARAPSLATPEALVNSEAFGVASGLSLSEPAAIHGSIALPPLGTRLRRNPLYDAGGLLIWPSDRYGREYGCRVTYPSHTNAPKHAIRGVVCDEQVRRRELVELPERW